MIVKWIRFVPALAWMALIFYLSSIPDLKLDNQFSAFDFVLRKIAHMVEYAILFSLLFWGLGNDKQNSSTMTFAALMAGLYAVSDEVHQHFVPTRNGAITDILIDWTGIAIGWTLLKFRYATRNHDSH